MFAISLRFEHDNTKGENGTKHFHSNYYEVPSISKCGGTHYSWQRGASCFEILYSNNVTPHSYASHQTWLTALEVSFCLSRATEGRLSFIATYQKQGEMGPGGTPYFEYPILGDTIYEEYVQSNNLWGSTPSRLKPFSMGTEQLGRESLYMVLLSRSERISTARRMKLRVVGTPLKRYGYDYSSLE